MEVEQNPAYLQGENGIYEITKSYYYQQWKTTVPPPVQLLDNYPIVSIGIDTQTKDRVFIFQLNREIMCIHTEIPFATDRSGPGSLAEPHEQKEDIDEEFARMMHRYISFCKLFHSKYPDCTNPILLCIRDVIEQGPMINIITNFFPGESLSHYPRDPAMNSSIMYVILEQLAEFHSRNFIFKFISSTNLYVKFPQEQKTPIETSRFQRDVSPIPQEFEIKLGFSTVGLTKDIAFELGLINKAIPKSDIYQLGCTFFSPVNIGDGRLENLLIRPNNWSRYPLELTDILWSMVLIFPDTRPTALECMQMLKGQLQSEPLKKMQEAIQKIIDDNKFFEENKYAFCPYVDGKETGMTIYDLLDVDYIANIKQAVSYNEIDNDCLERIRTSPIVPYTAKEFLEKYDMGSIRLYLSRKNL